MLWLQLCRHTNPRVSCAEAIVCTTEQMAHCLAAHGASGVRAVLRDPIWTGVQAVWTRRTRLLQAQGAARCMRITLLRVSVHAEMPFMCLMDTKQRDLMSEMVAEQRHYMSE